MARRKTDKSDPQFDELARQADEAEEARRAALRQAHEKAERDDRLQRAVTTFRHATDALWSLPESADAKDVRRRLRSIGQALVEAVQALKDASCWLWPSLGPDDRKEVYARFRVRNYREMSRASFDWACHLFDLAGNGEPIEAQCLQTWQRESLRDAIRWLSIFVHGLSGEGAVLSAKQQSGGHGAENPADDPQRRNLGRPSYTVKPPHWLLCGGKQIKVGPNRYALLEFMQGKTEALTEEAEAALGDSDFHKTKTELNQFLGRHGVAFHFQSGRDGKLRLVAAAYQKPDEAGKRSGKSSKRKRK
jgi:hypothetical protein